MSYVTDTEREAKSRMTTDLVVLEDALDAFLSGEVCAGKINSFKLTLIVQARTLQAVAEKSRADVIKCQIRD